MGVPRKRRIRRSSDFGRTLRAGVRLDGRLFVVFVRRGTHPAMPRLGLSVGRRVGGAVVRSRVKRLLREAFCSVATEPWGLDVVLVAKADAAHAALRDLARELTQRMGAWRSRQRTLLAC